MQTRTHPSGFKTGARPSPRHVLAAATPHRAPCAGPPQVAYVPKQLSFWGNQTDGDCVAAEEAFAKACNSPEIFITEENVLAWARQNGFLNGADLATVLDLMAYRGFVQDGEMYCDGGKLSVNYADEAALQSAIAQGPVKIAIDAAALPSNAGGRNGWFATGGRFSDTDHCVSIAGYGPTAWLFGQLGMPVPARLPETGYLVFTWSSIGFVDAEWIMGTCAEAWVRNPTTVATGQGPSPLPVPTQGSFDQIMQALLAQVRRPRIRQMLAYIMQVGDSLGLGGQPFGAVLAQLAAMYPQLAMWLQWIRGLVNPASSRPSWPPPSLPPVPEWRDW